MSAVQHRERRATAGKRMTFLAGEELEQDEQFWGHETWQEDSESFNSSDVPDEDAVDEFDSDFDVSESDHEEEEEAIGAAEEREILQEERDSKKRSTAAAYTDTKANNKKKQSTKTNKSSVNDKKGVGRWSKGKRIMGDGLNAGIVLNIPLAYQPKIQQPQPASSSLSLPTAPSIGGTNGSIEQNSIQPKTTTTTSTLAATSQYAAVESDGNALPQQPISMLSSIPTSSTQSLAPETQQDQASQSITHLKLHGTPRKKNFAGPTLAATRVRRRNEGRVRDSTAVATKANKVAAAAVAAQSNANAHHNALSRNKGKRRFTQEEMLLEAVKETEPENERWILGRKRRQAEKDEKESSLTVRNDQLKGTQVIEKFVSRRGYLTTITFPSMDHLPPLLSRMSSTTTTTTPATTSTLSHQERCVITGQVARYRDPVTNMPYANVAAFQELRRRRLANEPLVVVSREHNDSERHAAQSTAIDQSPVVQSEASIVTRNDDVVVSANVVNGMTGSTIVNIKDSSIQPLSYAEKPPTSSMMSANDTKPPEDARQNPPNEGKATKPLNALVDATFAHSEPSSLGDSVVTRAIADNRPESHVGTVENKNGMSSESTTGSGTAVPIPFLPSRTSPVSTSMDTMGHSRGSHAVSTSRPQMEGAPTSPPLTSSSSPASPERRSPRNRRLSSKALENIASGQQDRLMTPHLPQHHHVSPTPIETSTGTATTTTPTTAAISGRLH